MNTADLREAFTAYEAAPSEESRQRYMAAFDAAYRAARETVRGRTPKADVIDVLEYLVDALRRDGERGSGLVAEPPTGTGLSVADLRGPPDSGPWCGSECPSCRGCRCSDLSCYAAGETCACAAPAVEPPCAT